MTRRMNRIAGAALLLAFGLALGSCEDFDMDKLDVFHLNEKKKLPGERKDIFPGGVPGVTEGVPPELVKGHQPPPETATALPAEDEAAKKAAAVEPEQEAKPKPKKAASKPKAHVAKRAPARVTVKPAAQPAAPQAPAQQTEASGTQSPWPAQNPQSQGTGTNAPWPSTTAPQPSPWPSAPASGTPSQ